MATSQIAAEFERAELGDARRTRRVSLIAERWLAAPAASFPDMVADDAELQGLYGLHENEDVDPVAVLEPHRMQTRERVRASGEHVVLTLHDTTTFSFGGAVHREDMGWLSKHQQGFHAHFALVISADGSRRPFGIVGLSTRMRPRPSQKKPKRNGRASAADPNRESLRWPTLVRETDAFLKGSASPIHIADREADTYEMLSEYATLSARHVTRVRETKRPVTMLAEETAVLALRGAAERTIPIIGRSATLSRRNKSNLPDANKTHPPRDGRTARLEFAANRVRIAKPKQHPNDQLVPHLEVNLVHVREVDAPDDVEPVEWLLYTSEPVDTADDVLRVVDYYRARWTIEEFFKAIKTGCGYEKRQLASTHALLISLSICIPVAWQLLLLRHQSRTAPEAPASTVLSPERLNALRTIARYEISANPSAAEVYRAIAMLGGYIRWSKKPPGWATLSKGLEKLLFAEEVLAAATAKAAQRCD